MGSDGTTWASDPAVAWQTYVVPQGIGADLIATLDGFSRADVDAFAAESQRRAAQAWNAGLFSGSVTPVRDVLGEVVLERDEHVQKMLRSSLGALKARVRDQGEQAGFDAVAQLRYPHVEAIRHVHTAGNWSGRRRWRGRRPRRQPPFRWGGSGGRRGRGCVPSRRTAASPRSCSRVRRS